MIPRTQTIRSSIAGLRSERDDDMSGWELVSGFGSVGVFSVVVMETEVGKMSQAAKTGV